jgi:hypothetical protein
VGEEEGVRGEGRGERGERRGERGEGREISTWMIQVLRFIKYHIG